MSNHNTDSNSEEPIRINKEYNSKFRTINSFDTGWAMGKYSYHNPEDDKYLR